MVHREGRDVAGPEVRPPGGGGPVRGRVRVPGGDGVPVRAPRPRPRPGRRDPADRAGRGRLPGDDHQPAHDGAPTP